MPVLGLDVLELVRRGALDRWPATAPAGTVELGALLDMPVSGAGRVELMDQEQVSVAWFELGSGTGGTAAGGRPRWQGWRSSRPFEQWHRDPDEVAGRTGVVVLEEAADPVALRRALDDAGPLPLLLLLASLDGDVSPGLIQAARQCVAEVSERPGAQLAIAPRSLWLTDEDREQVVRRYAAGRPVWELEPDPEEIASTQPSSGTRSGTVLFFTGLSGAGKSTLARAVRNRLVEDGRRVTLLNGDLVRRRLSAGLGFSAADRETNIRRIGRVAAEVAHHGGTAICSPIAPFERTRQKVRQMVRSRGGRFLLIHVATPLSECERRDRKGLYARARRGEVADFTEISSPYEEPGEPDLRLDTTGHDVTTLVDEVLALLDDGARC